MDAVDRIAETVLYEGYILWPYRRSALKNQQRWTFGGVHPPAYSASTDHSDACEMQTQVLLQGGRRPAVGVSVRFLQVVRRQAVELRDGLQVECGEVEANGRRHLSWDESVERRVEVHDLQLQETDAPVELEVDIPPGSSTEWLDHRAALIRSWERIRGRVRISAEPVEGGLWRLTVHIANLSDFEGTERHQAVRRSMVSTHTVLKAQDGQFVSCTAPPDSLAARVAGCRNLGCWPVLVGEEPDASTLLASPIILYDYPQVAPESPGMMFDGGEIDQLLVLNVLSLTDEEKLEMAGTDPRALRILESAQALSPEELGRLHGRLAPGWSSR